MFKKSTLGLAFLTVFTWQIHSQADLLPIQVDVVFLSSDLLEGRSTGTKGEQLASNYIAKRYEQIGLIPKGNNGSYFQTFDFKYKKNPHVEGGEDRTGRNVSGYIDNGAETTVIIGAHYDHLGHGDFGSLFVEDPAIHNGADDNASGIAALLRLAEQLKNSSLKSNNYLFIAFSGEELGLYGSKFFVNNTGFDSTNVNYMLNMDMVGRLNSEKVLVINGAGTSPAWKEHFEKIKDELKINTTDGGIGPSDHTSFYLAGIPAIHFFTGQHADYHKPSDDSELVNYEGIREVSDFIFRLISELNDDGKIAFTKTKDENEGRQAANFKVTLGVMPDYTYQGEGMRIDGAMEGRPAQKAGLEKGDIIIKIGDIDVKSIYDYMEGLSKFKKGESTRVAVKRGDKIMVKTVEF